MEAVILPLDQVFDYKAWFESLVVVTVERFRFLTLWDRMLNCGEKWVRICGSRLPIYRDLQVDLEYLIMLLDSPKSRERQGGQRRRLSRRLGCSFRRVWMQARMDGYRLLPCMDAGLWQAWFHWKTDTVSWTHFNNQKYEFEQFLSFTNWCFKQKKKKSKLEASCLQQTKSTPKASIQYWGEGKQLFIRIPKKLWRWKTFCNLSDFGLWESLDSM